MNHLNNYQEFLLKDSSYLCHVEKIKDSCKPGETELINIKSLMIPDDIKVRAFNEIGVDEKDFATQKALTHARFHDDLLFHSSEKEHLLINKIKLKNE